MTLKELVANIGIELRDDCFEVSGMNTLSDANETEISFVANPKYLKEVSASKAGAILIDEANKEKVPQNTIALVVDSPYWEMATLSKFFATPIEDDTLAEAVIGEGTRVSSKAEVANGVVIGKNCTIMAGVYVGTNCKIGDNTILYPNVVVYKECEIGSDCIIHSGTVIGSDGFGFASNKMGEHNKIYHNGNVVIGDDVEIGSNTSIDRAVFGSTKIKTGARLDNLIQVGHNCEIGEYCVAAGQSGFAGSTKIGRSNVFGAQSGTAGHLVIEPFNTFAARSGITKSINSSGKTYAGFPVVDHKMWLKIQGKLARLVKRT
jgi:UDP-3-O-[3-hydroxymyristoyl] glucosamine N-acyltransferase